ncbi:SDR family oxidoreductase [Streptomyces platensis]|uniref:SDR family oxidoreductase n=1 Tax=Streptomyces platensis TaxID=58346 RepID=UPI00386B20F8
MPESEPLPRAIFDAGHSPTDTDLLRNSAQTDALEGAAAMTALGRIGRPSDVADLVALLVRADNRWVTGQNIRADGGLT